MGTIGPQDGADLLLRSAIDIVKQKGREDIRFAIIASDSELLRLKGMAAKFAFSGNLEFTGRIEHVQADVRLANSDICVSPDPLHSFNDNFSMIKSSSTWRTQNRLRCSMGKKAGGRRRGALRTAQRSAGFWRADLKAGGFGSAPRTALRMRTKARRRSLQLGSAKARS